MFAGLNRAEISASHKIRSLAAPLLAFVLCLGLSLNAAGQAADPSLAADIDGPQRSDANKARDRYRHPLEVLTFFGVKADSNVVEIMPGRAGYWTEILAPYLKDRGHHTPPATPSGTLHLSRCGLRQAPVSMGRPLLPSSPASTKKSRLPAAPISC